MDSLSVGDLFANYRLLGRNTALKTEIDSLTEALASGQKPNIAAEVGGDFVPLAAFERDLANRAAYRIAGQEAADFTAAAQTALDTVSKAAVSLAPSLLSAAELYPYSLSTAVGRDGIEGFEVTVNALNGRFADRSIFGGTATERAPLAPPEDILNALRTAVGAATTAADVKTIVDDWFDPGGDFETVAYTGSTTALADLRVAEDISVGFPITANDAEMRQVLKGFALAALVQTSPAGGDQAEQEELARLAGLELLAADPALQDVRASVGAAEAQIERGNVRNEAEIAAIELARAALLEADTYETAIELESTQSLLEALYTVTARSARLSFSEFIS